MKFSALVAMLLSFSFSVSACNEINGVYESASETHWSFSLSIDDNQAVLIYADYQAGKGNMRTNSKTESIGTCSNNGNEYVLSFLEKKIDIQYSPSLSHQPFGGISSSPAISGKFFNGKVVNLWQF